MLKHLFAVFFIFIVASQVFSQWTSNVAVNTPTCTATGDQATPKIASTSDGGCYIMWFDNRVPNYKVYLQRYDASGYELFPSNGLLVSGNAQNTSLQDFNIDVDASDNAVIVFTDRRNGTQLNPFAYLISPTGAFLWGPNGVSLTDSIGVSQNIPVCCATSDGNYVFAWDYVNVTQRIAMQKLDISGTPQWGSGAPLKLNGSGAEKLDYPRLTKSDNGSVILNWDDYTGTAFSTATCKIFIQKFAANASKLWTIPQDTVQNLARVAVISFQPTPVSDGANGVVLCWVDDRDANSRQAVFAQHYNSSGAIQFPKNGSTGSTVGTDNQFLPTVTYLSSGETVMFWTETNGGQTLVGGLNGQKFDATGNAQWGGGGIAFKGLDNNQLSFLAAFSKDTSVVISYTQLFFGSSNYWIKAMRTGPSGVPYWAGDTITASSILSSKIRKQASMNPVNGQTVMTWSDTRSGTGDIYSQNIKFNGEPGLSQVNLTVGIEGMWNGTTQVQDTMRVYLRNSTSPFSVFDSSKVYLDASGNAVAYFPPTVLNGNYYLQLIHRNAMETWSAAPVAISNSSSYDFTTSQSQAYGNNQSLTSGRSCMFSGEIIKDGFVNLSDIVAVSNDVTAFVTGYVPTDVDGNNITNLLDLIITYNNATLFVHLIRP